MHSQSPVGKITDIIKKLNSGIVFYASAVEKASTASYQSLFRRMWEEKEHAVQTLLPHSDLDDAGTKAKGNQCSDFHQIYDKLLGNVSGSEDQAYVQKLIDVEETILQAIDHALNDSPAQKSATSLRLVRTRTQQCHDEMLSLFKATGSGPV